MILDEIVNIAREAGVSIREHYDETGSTPQELELFFKAAYNAGAAAEREACAKVCDDLGKMGVNDTRDTCGTCAVAIRDRGENT